VISAKNLNFKHNSLSAVPEHSKVTWLDSRFRLILSKSKVTADCMSVVTNHSVSKLTLWLGQTQMKYLQLTSCLNLP
jgi:hypothetical protein